MTVALVALVTLVAASVQASTGIGFALVLTPVLFALVQPVGAIVTITALGLVLSLLVLFAERRRPSVAWNEVGPILAAAVPGSICGLVLLNLLPKPVLQTAVGIAVIGAASLRARARTRERMHVPIGVRWSRLTLGFATGTLSTSTGVNGPPLAIWLTSRGLSAGQIRDSLSALFLGTGVIAAVTLLPVIHRAHISLALLPTATLCVIAGHAAGSRVFHRLTSRYELMLLAIILAAGTVSLASGANHYLP